MAGEPPPGRHFITKEIAVKRLFASACLLVLLFLFALPAAAQASAAATNQQDVVKWVVITSGFSMAIASAICGLAQAKATAAACEGLARNPGAAGAIRFALILALVLIESLALYTFAIVFLKVSAG